MMAKGIVPTQVGPQATAADVRMAGKVSGHMRVLMTGTGTTPSVVHVRDTLMMDDASPVAPIARPAHVLSPTMPVYEALGRMRAASVQLAVVMENGQMLGSSLCPTSSSASCPPGKPAMAPA